MYAQVEYQRLLGNSDIVWSRPGVACMLMVEYQRLLANSDIVRPPQDVACVLKVDLSLVFVVS